MLRYDVYFAIRARGDGSPKAPLSYSHVCTQMIYKILLVQLPSYNSDGVKRLAQGVSKAWRQFLITSYQTYNVVDFSAAKRPVSKYALKTCVSRSKGNITKLVVNRLNFAEGEPLVYLAARCKYLSYVQIMGGSFGSLSIVEMAKATENLKTLVLSCSTSMSAIADVINQCDKLESLECTAVTANTPALWNACKPMSLRRLLLASANNSLIENVRLVSFGLSYRVKIFSLTALSSAARIIGATTENSRIGAPGLGGKSRSTGFLCP